MTKNNKPSQRGHSRAGRKEANMPYIHLTDEEADALCKINPTLTITDTRETILAAVLSISEAATLWNINTSTIRHAIRQGRLYTGLDCRKTDSGPWIITRSAMRRVFGEQPETER